MMQITIKKIILVIVDLLKLVLVLMRTALTFNEKPSITREVRKKALYIMGNGPSLQNFKGIKINREEVCLCTVNFSILTDVFYDLKPDYHVFADSAFFKEEIPQVTDIYDAFLNKVDWNIELLVPLTVEKKVATRLRSNPSIKVKGYRNRVWEPQNKSLKNLKFYFYSKNFICPPIQNVCVACIYNGINMGYKNIFLYGVEHSWTSLMIVNNDNVVCLKNQHFYNMETEYTPFYISDPNGPVFKMHEALNAFSKMFYGYICLQEYADYIGDVKIINRTKGSFIDAFNRE